MNSTAYRHCNWCHAEGRNVDAVKAVKLINGTFAGACQDHLGPYADNQTHPDQTDG